jgi:hypothetical protein
VNGVLTGAKPLKAELDALLTAVTDAVDLAADGNAAGGYTVRLRAS